MPLHQFAIGPKIYNLPYDKPEDLQEMNKICSKLNTYINNLILETGITDSDVVVMLACMNLMYEKDLYAKNAPKDLFEQSAATATGLSEDDVLSLINLISKQVRGIYEKK